MTDLIMAAATGLYAGRLPLAPGTWGSLVGLALYYLLRNLSLPVYLGVLAGLLLVGIYVCGSAEKILDRRDPQEVVIDEIAGMLITLLAAPPDYLYWFLGFVLFRFFDIAKPFPIRLVDQRIQGGIGIMLDDVLAGLYSLLTLQLLYRFILN